MPGDGPLLGHGPPRMRMMRPGFPGGPMPPPHMMGPPRAGMRPRGPFVPRHRGMRPDGHRMHPPDGHRMAAPEGHRMPAPDGHRMPGAPFGQQHFRGPVPRQGHPRMPMGKTLTLILKIYNMGGTI